jgi:hypothetical protein
MDPMSLNSDELLEFKFDGEHAGILVELSAPFPKDLEEAKKIVIESGVRILEIKNISPNWILIVLDAKDMRGTVLKLTESGFLNIKGFNARERDSKI